MGTASPSAAPSASSSAAPSARPSAAPTARPSAAPSAASSTSPSVEVQCENDSKVRFQVPKSNGKQKNTKCKKIKEKDCGTEFTFKKRVDSMSTGKPQDFCHKSCNLTVCCI